MDSSKQDLDRPPAPTTADGSQLSELFRRFASVASNRVGSHWAFLGALLLILVWAISGPLWHFSETWQLVINTGTTIITFLMVFLIQATQNRDAKAIHLKLDELIRSSKARNVFADLEDATEQELETFQREFIELRRAGLDEGEASERAHESMRKHKKGGHGVAKTHPGDE